MNGTEMAFCLLTILCADVPLRNYSLTHSWCSRHLSAAEVVGKVELWTAGTGRDDVTKDTWSIVW